jgi:hypothetical protein
MHTKYWWENPEVVRYLGRPWCGFENIEMDLRIKGVKVWIGLKWHIIGSSVFVSLLNMAMNFWVP